MRVNSVEWFVLGEDVEDTGIGDHQRTNLTRLGSEGSRTYPRGLITVYIGVQAGKHCVKPYISLPVPAPPVILHTSLLICRPSADLHVSSGLASQPLRFLIFIKAQHLAHIWAIGIDSQGRVSKVDLFSSLLDMENYISPWTIYIFKHLNSFVLRG